MILEIISPEKIFYKGEVEMVIVPGSLGPFTILPQHAAIISTLDAGDVIYVVEEKEYRLAINSGFVEVRNNIITVCVEKLGAKADNKNNNSQVK